MRNYIFSYATHMYTLYLDLKCAIIFNNHFLVCFSSSPSLSLPLPLSSLFSLADIHLYRLSPGGWLDINPLPVSGCDPLPPSCSLDPSTQTSILRMNLHASPVHTPLPLLLSACRFFTRRSFQSSKSPHFHSFIPTLVLLWYPLLFLVSGRLPQTHSWNHMLRHKIY